MRPGIVHRSVNLASSLRQTFMLKRIHLATWIFICAAIAALLVMLLLVTGHRVLISERRVNPGDTHVVAEWGDLGKAEQPQLVCRYFTGRSIKTNVLWYSANNIMGRDECPFLVKE